MKDDAAQKAMDGAKQGQAQFERVMPAAWLRRLGCYGLALLLVAIGVAIRALLTRLVGSSLPTYVTFYPLVVLAALVGGWGPGLLAILAAAVVADYWLLPPRGLFKFESNVDLVGLAFFCIMGLLVNVVAQLYRRIRTRLEELVLLRTATLEQANEQLQSQAEELQAQTEELQAQAEELQTQTEELQAQTEELAVTNAALRESEQRWATTLASIGDAVMTTDVDGKITFMNPVAEALTGWTRSAASTKPLEDVFRIISEQSRQRVESPADKALKEGRIVGLTNHALLVRKDGAEIPIDDSAAPIRDKEGNVRGVVLVFRDITDRKRTQEALRQSERRLHQLFEEDLTGDFLCTREGRVLLCNAAFADIFGYSSADAAVGRSMLELYIDVGERDSILTTLREQGKLAYYETWRKRRDGALIHVVENLVGHFNDQGELYEIQGYIFDDTERKQAEEALQESEAQYRELVQNANSAIVRWKVDGTVTFFNEYAQNFFGYEEDEIVGKDVRILLPEEDSSGEDLSGLVRDIVANPERFVNSINENVRRDGRRVWMAWTNKPVLDENGHALEILAVGADITERKRAEEAQRESEQKYRTIVETATEAMVIVDAQARIVFVNGRWSEMFGYSEEQARHMTHFDLLFPEDVARQKERWESRQVGRKESYELRLRRKDGSPVWVLAGITPNFGPAGEFLGTLNMLADITDRKRAEEALRQNEEQFRQLAENIEEVFFLITPDWSEVLYISPAYERVWGRSCQSLYDSARSWLEAVVEEDRPAAVASMEQGVAGVLPKTFPEYRILRPDGTQRWILARCWPIFDSQGNIYRVAGIAEDTTERKAAEEALHTLNATLERKVAQRTEELERRARQLQKLTLELTQAEERERARIAEVLHDDLQQVLAAAKFQMSFLRSRVKNNAEVQEIAGQTRDMLVEAIAKSRNLSHELSSPALSQTNLCAAFGWLAEQMQTMHGFTIHLEMDDPLGVPSEALRMLLYKAAQELLFNAIKHAGVAEAKLRLRRQRRGFRLSVSDRGRGIDPADPAYKPGYGLLSIRERVELLGGRLTIRSAPGRGSTFSVAIPDHEAIQAAP